MILPGCILLQWPPVGARLQRAAAASIFENGVGGHALKTRASLGSVTLQLFLQ